MEIKERTPVTYVPSYVKYHPSLHRTGWDITSQATSREDLYSRSIVAEDEPFIQEHTPGVQEET